MKLNIREIEDESWEADSKVEEWPHNWEWEGRFQRSSGRLKPWKLSAQRLKRNMRGGFGGGKPRLVEADMMPGQGAW